MGKYRLRMWCPERGGRGLKICYKKECKLKVKRPKVTNKSYQKGRWCKLGCRSKVGRSKGCKKVYVSSKMLASNTNTKMMKSSSWGTKNKSNLNSRKTCTIEFYRLRRRGYQYVNLVETYHYTWSWKIREILNRIIHSNDR